MQLLYLCSEQNAGMLDEPCRKSDILFQQRVGIHDLNRLTVQEVRSLGCYRYLVIDVLALSDPEESIISAIIGLRSMYNGLIIILLAVGYPPDHPLLVWLVEEGFYNLVTATETTQQQADLLRCLIGEGMQCKDAPKNQVTECDKFPGEKKNVPKESLNRMLSVGVYGVMHRIGTTTQALHITKFLNENGYKACYIEDNGQQHIATIPDFYSDVEEVNNGLLYFDGIDIYTEFDPSRIFTKGYDYLVYDSGLITGTDMQRFYSRDAIVICAGSSPWEMPYLQSMLRQTGIYEHPNIHFVFSFSDPRIERAIRHFMGRYAEWSHFVRYAPEVVDGGGMKDYYSIFTSNRG